MRAALVELFRCHASPCVTINERARIAAAAWEERKKRLRRQPAQQSRGGVVRCTNQPAAIAAILHVSLIFCRTRESTTDYRFDKTFDSRLGVSVLLNFAFFCSLPPPPPPCRKDRRCQRRCLKALRHAFEGDYSQTPIRIYA